MKSKELKELMKISEEMDRKSWEATKKIIKSKSPTDEEKKMK